MRARTALGLALAGLAAGCGSGTSYGGGMSAPAPTACTAANAIAPAGGTISMVGMAFSPACAKVPAGTTVTFSNDSNLQHTVTADSGAFDSGLVNPNATYSRAFPTAGTVGIHCTIHAGMTLTLIVQ